MRMAKVIRYHIPPQNDKTTESWFKALAFTAVQILKSWEF
jgi:hypothetical protein